MPTTPSTAGLAQPVQATISTPLGPLIVVTDAQGVLHAAEWEDCAARLPADLRSCPAGPAAPGVVAAFDHYFDGDLDQLSTICVAARGTPFQRQVWQALRAIPAGTTLTYGALARALARPQASRAVGHANGANPFSVVVPCHRLLGVKGLTGYGGGLDRKRWLLAHEARHAGHRAMVPGGG